MAAHIKKRRKHVLLLSGLNIILISCVIISVLNAFNDASDNSFSQNIENILTLTNASANKVELEIEYYSDEISTVCGYINQYNNNKGMTVDEMCEYFEACYNFQDKYTWHLIDSELNDKSESARGFDAVSLCSKDTNVFSYVVNAYQELAKIFIAADESNVGKVQCTSEFTDSLTLTKSFAVTSTVKVAPVDSYGQVKYKTLMLLVKSSYMNELIINNNDIDTLSYFDYSNIIIDNDGNYVISNAYFQGTNFIKYMSVYNKNFGEKASQVCDNLKTENYSDVFFYNNNKNQKCAYTIVPIQNSDWHILSMVPLSSFRNTYNISKNLMPFVAFFSLLFIIDITFIMIINYRLRIKTKEAEEANQSKSVFLSSMSHDIRTPMNAIMGMTTIANRQLEDEDADLASLKECMKSIELSGNHLLTLINDILDISKIESGKIILHPSDFSIAETVSLEIEMCHSMIDDKDLEFEIHMNNIVNEYVTGDSLRINQIFINLLTNAVKYTLPGGKVTVGLTEEKISDSDDTARYIYSVSDTGIGMTEEFLKNIFDRFTRAVDTRINSVQGTGLGMAIVKQLVDLMNGTITVKSEINVGSEFVVTLDLPVVKRSMDCLACKNLKILLIDDDQIILDSVKPLLTEAGASVDTACGGRTGIDKAISHKEHSDEYSIIFVDWKMSQINGLEVVSQLRKLLGSGVRIIVMTAYNLSEIEKQARCAGADYFITKPLFRSRLFSVIESAMSGKEIAVRTETLKFPQMKILVVEDNDINWKVINRILKFYEINADRAVNGKEAVETVKNCTQMYDLIFMDIQMPVMNGYQATEEIRKIDDRSKSDVPVYAMTADTFAGDIEKCIRCGMNGHVSKPIDVGNVIGIIRKINDNKLMGDIYNG